MKMNFAYNLLKSLRSKKDEGGFTLIELLVVIIIIGILAAIALPSFLNQANRARETEATNAVGSLNRGQQAYYLERVNFATEFAQLDVGVAINSENYAYGTSADAQTPEQDVGDGQFIVDDADDPQVAAVVASPRDGLRGFVGFSYIDVQQIDDGAGGTIDKNVSVAALCREVAGDVADGGVANAPDAVDEPAAGTTAETLCEDTGMEAVN
ncbi:type IV pilin-like G/H family protein [Leptolyngbya iicbica]|uniref:Prepilin-type N-terminal cleavage/methylation domain-containing protein n=2 Tax=Cyanophyceae TaxID=3028117 RepID=A0A4Q7EGZ5_9CYAN|nr:type IV pilin-like G/H family protein [Leptolyngbya sp. LK]RZM82258.1 prepilin-type N-terminal cleavage/methylation domain-containing protein [Leptolyngbya sp. LK]